MERQVLIIDLLLSKYDLKEGKHKYVLDICKKVDYSIILKKTHAINQNEVRGSN